MEEDKNINWYKIEIAPGYVLEKNVSIAFDKRLLMESGERDITPIQEFIESIYPELPIKASEVNKKKKKEALNSLITNSMVALKEGKVVAIPRGNGNYSNSSFYGLDYYTHTFIVGGMDALVESGYFKQRKGYYDKLTNEGEVSRVWPSKKLIDELNNYAATILIQSDNEEEEGCRIHFLYGFKLKRRKLKNPIVLKDENKNEIGYKKSDEILKMRLFLNHYNNFVEKESITLPLELLYTQKTKPINPINQNTTIGLQEYTNQYSTPLLGETEVKYLNFIELDCWFYRVFNNGKFTEGGRFYGAEYQSLSEEARAKIRINGNATIEADYEALHIRMLYNKEGIDYKSDPYTEVSPILDLRTPIKKLLQIMINAKTEQKAIKAFQKYLNENPEM